jgi:hypothetical protein
VNGSQDIAVNFVTRAVLEGDIIPPLRPRGIPSVIFNLTGRRFGPAVRRGRAAQQTDPVVMLSKPFALLLFGRVAAAAMRRVLERTHRSQNRTISESLHDVGQPKETRPSRHARRTSDARSSDGRSILLRAWSGSGPTGRLHPPDRHEPGLVISLPVCVRVVRLSGARAEANLSGSSAHPEEGHRRIRSQRAVDCPRKTSSPSERERVSRAPSSGLGELFSSRRRSSWAWRRTRMP